MISAESSHGGPGTRILLSTPPDRWKHHRTLHTTTVDDRMYNEMERDMKAKGGHGLMTTEKADENPEHEKDDDMGTGIHHMMTGTVINDDGTTFDDTTDRKENGPLRKRFRNAINGIGDSMYYLRYRMRSLKNSTGDAIARMNKGYDKSAVYDFGPHLLDDIVKRLREYADTCTGYPTSYDDKTNWLKPRDDEWEDEPAPIGAERALNPNGDVSNGDVVPADGGFGVHRKTDDGRVICTLARNKDVGIEFAAWIEDVMYTANVIEMWAHVNDDIEWLDKESDVYGRQTAIEHYNEIGRQFAVVWEWLGRHIMELWA